MFPVIAGAGIGLFIIDAQEKTRLVLDKDSRLMVIYLASGIIPFIFTN